MTRAKTKASASKITDAKSKTSTSQTTTAQKSKASAQATKPPDPAIEVLKSQSASPADPLTPSLAEEPTAIQKGRQPKHINSTQAIAMGTAAAGISHLLGWL